MNIKPVDMVESLSIPAQQIARVIRDSNDLTADERALATKIIDIDLVPEEYVPWISDPIKELIRRNDQSYIKEHLGDYLNLYIRLGLRHPVQYVKAWIDQTKGYWNGGYDFWIWDVYIYNNNHGISRQSNAAAEVIDGYGRLFLGGGVLSVFVSTGLMTWVLMALLYLEIRSKNLKGVVILLPLFLIIGTLLVATPVFAEFRYVYAIYATMPFVACMAFFDKKLYNKSVVYEKQDCLSSKTDR